MDTNLDHEFLEKLQAQIIEDAKKVYSEKVIERWLSPRNMGTIEDPQGYGKITGPCGDTMEIFLRINKDTIIEAKFLTDGCVTTLASGSMATELAVRKTISEALKIGQQTILENLGGLPPESEHCALLASDTLKKALRDYLANKRDPWKKVYKKY